MYRLMIVEDEEYTSAAIETLIVKKCPNISVCAKARDGQEALIYVQNTKPDILITDIRMSHMDGLTFIEELKKRGIGPKIIILTGYAEFEYARKALQLEVAEYILKPVDENNFIEVINKIVEEIQEEEKNIFERERMENKFSQSKIYLAEKYLKQLIYGHHQDLNDILYSLKELNIDLYGCLFQIFVIVIDDIVEMRHNQTEECIQSLKCSVINFLHKNIEENFNGGIFEDNNGSIVAIIKYHRLRSIAECDRFTISYALKTADYARKYLKMTISIGISCVKTEASELKQAYFEAEQARQFMFYKGTNSVILYNNIANGPIYINMNTDTYNKLIMEQSMLEIYLSSGDKKNALEVMDRILAIFSDSGNIYPEEIYEAFLEIIKVIKKVIRENQLEKEGDSILCIGLEQLRSCSTLSKLYLYTCEKISEFCEKISSISIRSGNRTITMAKQYVNDFYHQDINLDVISSYCNVSKSYFCYLFKKETGYNFWHYLMKIRIDKAKELLKRTNLKIYEIAEKVGYKDVSYFSSIFKQFSGMKPLEYRNFAS